MKRRVLKKQMRRVLDSALPTMFKLSAMHEFIKASQKSSWFQFSDLPYVRFDRKASRNPTVFRQWVRQAVLPHNKLFLKQNSNFAIYKFGG